MKWNYAFLFQTLVFSNALVSFVNILDHQRMPHALRKISLALKRQGPYETQGMTPPWTNSEDGRERPGNCLRSKRPMSRSPSSFYRLLYMPSLQQPISKLGTSTISWPNGRPVTQLLSKLRQEVSSSGLQGILKTSSNYLTRPYLKIIRKVGDIAQRQTTCLVCICPVLPKCVCGGGRLRTSESVIYQLFWEY